MTQRSRWLPLLLLLLPLASCLDAIGIGSACEAEMQRVRRAEGSPSWTRPGVRTELWYYNPPRNFYFEFSWSGETCTVRGPFSENRIPAWPYGLDHHPGETR